MGKYDVLMGKYLSNRERFADFFNGVLFGGEQVVDPDMLERGAGDYQAAGKENQKPGDRSKDVNSCRRKGFVEKKYRDLKMKCDFKGMLRVFAMENQNQVDYTMPLRRMEYDMFEYLEQLRNIKNTHKTEGTSLKGAEKLCGIKKTDRLIPVYTICLYHGEADWDGPKNLADMMQFDENDEMKKYFTDYPMRLFCVNEHQDFQIFHTELRQLFRVLQCRKNKEQLLLLLENTKEYQHLSEETYEIITAFLNIPELWNIREQFRQKNKSEEYNMCQAIQELRESERREGKNEGRIEGRIEQMILDNLEENKSKEIIVGKLMRRFALNEEQAETYFDKYAVVMI